MKILLVSWSTLPNKGGSSIIVENLARNFTKEELVVLGSKKLFQDTYVKRDLAGPKFLYFFSEIDVMGRGLRFFEWFKKLRFTALVKYIKKIIQQEEIDYVVGVYPDAIYCHAACIAAKEFNLPFSTYFHNTYVENLAIAESKASPIQNEIFDYAQHVFVMSDGMKNFYEHKYNDNKFVSLVHTFNAYPKVKNPTGIPGIDKSSYKLVAIGNFNESNVEATTRFIDAIKSNPKYSLSLYTHVPKILLKQRGIDIDAIDYKGFVSPDQVHEVLQEYDICVLTHGFTGGYGEVEYKTIFPTRTIPILLSGKPIIAHSPQGSFLNNFITENKCADLIDIPDKSLILDRLDTITSDLSYQKELVGASKKTAEKFYGPEVVKKWKAILAEDNAQ
jgi:hypothetical protein